MNTASRTLIAISVTLVVVVLALWFTNRGAVVREDTAPDNLQLGAVHAGATVEFSARFLVSSRRHPFDVFFERVLDRMPQSSVPALSKLHPKNFRKPPAAVDPATLKPSIQTPAFVRVQKTTVDSRTNWYQGRPFVTLDLALDTLRPGDYSGEIEVTLDRRRAALPVRVKIREKPADLPELLIATTPFEAYATEHGADFETATALLSALPLRVNYLQALPPELKSYQVILLADSALVDIGESEVARLRAFVEQGGRLILACNAFMVRSVTSANQVLADAGMQVVDNDYGRYVTVTNVAPDRLTRDVQHLEFHRHSLIQISDTTKAKALALATNSQSGFVAVSRRNNGGEIVVLTSSLWWHWLDRFKTNSDNARLMQNILLRD